MKILYHHRIKSKDGQFVHIEELVKQLKKLGHEIHMVGPVSEESEDFGSESRTLNLVRKVLPRFLYEFLEFCYCFLDFLQVTIAIRRVRPDVIYERFNLFTPSGIWAKRLYGLPLILEVNAPLVEERTSFGGLSLLRLAKWSQQYAWCGADRVVTVTEVLEDIIVGYGVDPKNIDVMPNGVDSDEFRFVEADRRSVRSKLGVQEQFVIGFTGFVRDWHRLDQVLDLLAEPTFKDAVLIIVGDGPAIEGLNERARALNLENRLIVTGIVRRNDVARFISGFDVAIQANVVEYASPLKVLEYLSMGRAIVAPQSRNIRELLSDGKNAILFDSGDQESLRAAIQTIMVDGEFRHSLEEAASRTTVERKLTWSHNAECVIELFDDLLREDSVV
jgi:glycosyltransferase involved in cell wall biosynthesis